MKLSSPGFIAIVFFMPLASAQAQTTQPAGVTINHAGLSKLHWQLACQASTFSDITFFEMVDRLHAMGVHHIELAPGQMMSTDFPGVTIGPEMTAPQIAAMQAKLKSVKMDIVSYGTLPVDESVDLTRKQFEFAKQFKVKNIVFSGDKDSLDVLDKLANEFSIHAALLAGAHGGKLVDQFNGRSPMIGICLDVAAAGSSANDVAKKLGARLIEVNLNDLSDHDTPLKDVLTTLKQSQFKGIFAVQSNAASDRQSHWTQTVNAFSAAIDSVN